jgi:glycosyltransferase involved in cell wall biosynthesis
MTIDIIIPAYNEEHSIGLVLSEIPRKLVREIVVVDNNSTDKTGNVAEKNGATVLKETFQGYGAACLKGIQYLKDKNDRPDLVIFLDGDHSDYPEEIEKLVHPFVNDGMDFVIGSRVKSLREKGSMLPQQLFGNWLATKLIRMLYGVRFYDLGPFRAIRFDKLLDLGMKDKTYGWTVEMQLRAIQKKLKWSEVPVRYRKRKGVSKISGTISGTFKAGYKIISTIIRYR